MWLVLRRCPLLNQARQLASELAGQDIRLNMELHPGGMFSKPHCMPVSERFRAMANHHDARIADLTGQIFGQAYQQELLFDTARILDSTPRPWRCWRRNPWQEKAQTCCTACKGALHRRARYHSRKSTATTGS
ncbi:hypothetical protein [Aliamphritea spongicola]|nr:hypothetical protein [Aliamphritea spongicola]